MLKRESYSYTVLRYVHDVMTGEFVNVGIVVHGASGIKFRFNSRTSRISNTFPGFDSKAFRGSLSAIKHAIASQALAEQNAGLFASKPDALMLAQRAMISDDSSFQWSPAGSGVSANLTITVDQLYARFVSRYEKQSGQRRDDSDVWKPIRAKLEALNVADHFQEQTFHGAIDEYKMRHAWKNGSWHAIEAYSFDLADAGEIKQKAHTIRGHLESLNDGFTEQLSLNLVLGMPTNGDLLAAFDVAKKILEHSAFRPVVVDESAADELLNKLAKKIVEHDASGVT
jgi:Protein of unknown function (DUF3037)